MSPISSTISSNPEFDEYWLQYLQAHSHPLNRACHYVGTGLGLFGGLLLVIFVGFLEGFILGIFGAGIAFAGHFVFEKNVPLVGKPLWGVWCDFLMLYLVIFRRAFFEKQLERSTAL